MLRAVIFDLDNTLIRKRPSAADRLLGMGFDPDAVDRACAMSEEWQGAQILRENETGVLMDDAQYAENVVLPFLRILAPDGSCDATIRDAVLGRHPFSYAPATGAAEVLAALTDMGIRLGVASNNRAEIRTALKELGIDRFFERVVLSDEIGILKPDPRILEAACAGVGASCAEAAYVGDHPFDILCARAAGMKIIWIPPNRHYRVPDGIGKPDHEIKTLREVPEIARRM